MPETTIDHLAAAVAGRVLGDGAVTVRDVRHDSRAVGPGELFVAVRGFTSDGHRHLDTAVAQGAAALCVDHDVAALVPRLVVPDTRAALPALAAEVHGHPSRRLTVIGVTGTNGKTMVTHFLEAIVAAAGGRPALAGTLGARIAGRRVSLARTTPESSDLQRLLAEMVAAGVDVAAIEVSSHALALGRVDHVHFAVAAFTNLSQDHLDFHDGMDDYFAAKARLFDPARADHAVVWVDDPWGRKLAGRIELPTTTAAFSPGADVHSAGLRGDVDGSSFDLVTPAGTVAARVAIPGRFNVANALVAAGCALQAGIPLDAVAAGLETVSRVAGRMDIVRVPGRPTVIVDYAHTPAGVAAVVESTRYFTRGRLVVVVGAGGDRDRDKRFGMGAAAAAADRVVVTSDNPRHEDPHEIVAAVAAGARSVGPDRVVEEPDRRAAIALAVREAGPEDVVLLLGKGHEQGQQVGDTILPFDDRTVAAEELSA